VINADASEFPFVAALPKREAKKVVSLWDQWQEFKAIVKHRGHVIPKPLAAKLAGVSKQRIHQLVGDGRLQTLEIGGSVFITEESFTSWVSSERKSGPRLRDSIAGRMHDALAK